MGGLAFTKDPHNLYTPRMPKDVYLEMKTRLYQTLQCFFLIVDSPIDGPGKTDFGDIDILVLGSLSDVLLPTSETDGLKRHIAQAFGTTIFIDVNGKQSTMQMAIPWPDVNPDGSLTKSLDSVQAEQILGTSCLKTYCLALEEKAEKDAAEMKVQERKAQVLIPTEFLMLGLQSTEVSKPENKHIQVDITFCNTVQELRWKMFRHSHGDIWNILGDIIRPYGLTVDEGGMYISIPEIETSNRSAAKVLMTDSYQEILLLLDLSPNVYWLGPFPNLYNMYEYIAGCAFFRAPESSGSLPIQEDEAVQESPKLTSKQRRRLDRPAYRKWVEEFKPQCIQNNRYLKNFPYSRDSTREIAFRTHPGLEERYKSQRQNFLEEKQRNEILTNMIKTSVPRASPDAPHDVMRRSLTIKALKQIIFDDDKSYGDIRPERSFKNSDGFFDIEHIKGFIMGNLERIQAEVMQRSFRSYNKKKAQDGEKKGTENE